MTQQIEILMDVAGHLIAGGPDKTFRYSMYGFITEPGDTPANTEFTPYISGPPIIERSAAEGAVGTVELLNNGELDELRDYTFCGCPVTFRIGRTGEAYGTFSILIVTHVTNIAVSRNKVIINFRDSRELLDRPIAPAVYLGTGGDEGDGLATGHNKPRVFGKVYGARPAFVLEKNTITHDDIVVSVNTDEDGVKAAFVSVGTVEGVVSRGRVLGGGTDYANRTALEAASLGNLQYATAKAEGFVRIRDDGVVLHSAMAQIYMDVIQQSAADAATLIDDIATEAGLTVVAADITALRAATTAEAGAYIADPDTTYRQTIDKLCDSIGAIWYFDELNRFRVRRIAPPGTSVYTLRTSAVGGIAANDLLVSNIEIQPRALPVWRVRVRYAAPFTTRRALAAIALYNPEILSSERRELAASLLVDPLYSVDEDTAVQTLNDRAEDITVDTALYAKADADAEATRLLGLLDTPGDRVFVEAGYDSIIGADLLGLNPGDTVTVVYDRFGWASGQKFIVNVMKINTRIQRIEFGLIHGGVA